MITVFPFVKKRIKIEIIARQNNSPAFNGFFSNNPHAPKNTATKGAVVIMRPIS